MSSSAYKTFFFFQLFIKCHLYSELIKTCILLHYFDIFGNKIIFIKGVMFPALSFVFIIHRTAKEIIIMCDFLFRLLGKHFFG